MDDRSPEALGLALAPRDHPLTCPGGWPEESGLLVKILLSPLDRLVFEGHGGPGSGASLSPPLRQALVVGRRNTAVPGAAHDDVAAPRP